MTDLSRLMPDDTPSTSRVCAWFTPPKRCSAVMFTYVWNDCAWHTASAGTNRSGLANLSAVAVLKRLCYARMAQTMSWCRSHGLGAAVKRRYH
jgi:hypothetical protein